MGSVGSLIVSLTITGWQSDLGSSFCRRCLRTECDHMIRTIGGTIRVR